jgi:lysophospholipase L1-like esterase
MVLHIGDSMAGALGIALNDELARHKVKGMLRFKTASYIPDWAGGRELGLYLAQLKPDLVLITLGANEVKMLDPARRAPLIRKIVGKLEGRPCVWIAPPVWTEERGMYQVIRDNIAPCRYMDTEQVYPDMPRLSDKIHPTFAARVEWAKRVVAWLRAERRPTQERPWALAPAP